ncbi:zinc knuckle CX2CX4HX4C containing protein, partial [Tanacetum coccineum]
MSNGKSKDDKSNETLGAKLNEGFRKQNLNSYASMVKMDDVGFKDEVGMNAVIEKGWMVKNKPLFVYKWSPQIGMKKVEPKKMHVWVKITQVPLEAWSTKGISALASSL